MKTKNMTTPHLKESISRSHLRLGFLLIPLAVALAWFAPSPTAQAVSPAPDGGYANDNTAEGQNALFSLTTGIQNTANGFDALFSDTTGSDNTATGSGALTKNTTGFGNTANGSGALLSNTIGKQNTASGVAALQSNTTGNFNTANGDGALQSNTTGAQNAANGGASLLSNTTGSFNTATGDQALRLNTTGNGNTATGFEALLKNTTASNNTATGAGALLTNTTGTDNTATGVNALLKNTTGTGNTATGVSALQSNTTAFNNTAEGHGATASGGAAVFVNSAGELGTLTSSARFKKEIKPMDKASEAILALKPVTFRYKKELDPEGIPQFGLVAEQVEKVSPDLVARDADGKVYSVRYEAVNAMLLNEFLKEHGTVQELKSTAAKQEAIIAQQQKAMEVLTATVKEQASQIQKVSAQLELSKGAPQMMADNQ
jgi:hypothetical protein